MLQPRKVIGSLICAVFAVAISVPCWGAEELASATEPVSGSALQVTNPDTRPSLMSRLLDSVVLDLFEGLAVGSDERRASPFEPPGQPPDRPPVPPGHGGEPPGQPPDRPPDHAQNDKEGT
jgi:hypothetical protein